MKSPKRGHRYDKFVDKDKVKIKLCCSCQKCALLLLQNNISTAVIWKLLLSIVTLSSETGVMNTKQDLTAVECSIPKWGVVYRESKYFLLAVYQVYSYLAL